MFVAGVLGAAIGYFMQWYSAVIGYPIDSEQMYRDYLALKSGQKIGDSRGMDILD